jgi:predicted O-methyltransferase YrrM
VKVPPLVERARASERDAVGSIEGSAGPLLHVLAAGRGVRRAAEIGNGTAVSSAWLASALSPGVPLFVVRQDEAGAATAAELFADDPDVRVLVGEWRLELAAHAPFDFVHVTDDDASDAVDGIVALAVPRATLVLGVPSGEEADAASRYRPWLDHPRLDATVVGAGHTPGALVVAVVRG